MGGVRGIILDSSVLLPSEDADANGDIILRPGADYLLRKLRYSGISVGISHEEGLSSPKEHCLQEMARTYSCTIFCLSPEDDISSEVARIWEDKGGSYIHVVSSCREELFHKENGSGWLKVIVGSAGRKPSKDAECVVATGMSSIFIDKLEELPSLICLLNKQAMGNEALTVGYVMKPSREEDFAKRGAFPLCPTQNGLIFLPLNYELPLSSQLQLVDAVLHKATDEILAVDMHGASEVSDKVTFTRNLQELQRYIKGQTYCCVIDPFNNIFPILDRLEIQNILIGLETLKIQGHCKVRAPHFLKVDSFDDLNLAQRLAEAKLSLPNIVKPQVACGVSDAHSMAIAFKEDQYKDLNVPLPAVVQEYVDHSSLIYKFYSLGSKIFYAVKKSIPNADTLMNLFAERGLKPLHFDSLKSLPVAKEQLNTHNHQIDLELVNCAADWLRRKLDLTIFGFDVVVQEGSGDHVIVDVNYLPSFKEVPDDVAIPAFWDALKQKIVSEKSASCSEGFSGRGSSPGNASCSGSSLRGFSGGGSSPGDASCSGSSLGGFSGEGSSPGDASCSGSSLGGFSGGGSSPEGFSEGGASCSGSSLEGFSGGGASCSDGFSGGGASCSDGFSGTGVSCSRSSLGGFSGISASCSGGSSGRGASCSMLSPKGFSRVSASCSGGFSNEGASCSGSLPEGFSGGGASCSSSSHGGFSDGAVSCSGSSLGGFSGGGASCSGSSPGGFSSGGASCSGLSLGGFSSEGASCSGSSTDGFSGGGASCS